MNSSTCLQRFIDAQQGIYDVTLAEIKAGQKRSHWMWFIFPQIAGLGYSETSRFFAINNLQEAALYLQHPILGRRLTEISNVLLTLPNKNARAIFGSPDDLKLLSSMTLFSLVPGADPVFQKVINEYFNGAADQTTIKLLDQEI